MLELVLVHSHGGEGLRKVWRTTQALYHPDGRVHVKFSAGGDQLQQRG